MIPNKGQIVTYHCVEDVMEHTNPAYCKGQFPAIVVEASDKYANLVVFNLVDGAPAVVRLSVPHESEAKVMAKTSDYWE